MSFEENQKRKARFLKRFAELSDAEKLQSAENLWMNNVDRKSMLMDCEERCNELSRENRQLKRADRVRLEAKKKGDE